MKKVITALMLAGIICLFGGCVKDILPSDKTDYAEETTLSEETVPSEETVLLEENEYNESRDETQVVIVEDPYETVILSEFIGKTVKEITDMFGTDYKVSEYNGGFYMSYPDQPFSFFYREPGEDNGIRSDVPAPTDIIFIVMSNYEGAKIVDGVEIGSEITALETYLNCSLSIELDEMEGYHYTAFIENGMRYIAIVDENNVITGCEIWS